MGWRVAAGWWSKFLKFYNRSFCYKELTIKRSGVKKLLDLIIDEYYYRNILYVNMKFKAIWSISYFNHENSVSSFRLKEIFMKDASESEDAIWK